MSVYDSLRMLSIEITHVHDCDGVYLCVRVLIRSLVFISGGRRETLTDLWRVSLFYYKLNTKALMLWDRLKLYNLLKCL